MTEQAQAAPVQDAPQTSQEPASSFAVPEAYASKGWAKDIKSPDDLWKLTDNAQSLIGKRATPAADAPAEEWNNYMKQLGMPENPDGYTLGDIEGTPEGFDLAPYKQQAQQLMHKAGLTPRQADALWKEYISTELAASGKAQADADKAYGELTAKHFGDKLSEVEAVAQEAIKAFVPEELRGALSKAPADALVAMQALASNAKAEIDRIKKEYGAEGKLPSGESVPNASIDEQRKELAALRSSKDATDPTSPKYKETRAKIDEMSASVRRALNGA
jgi:hypothetical protein